MTSDNPYESSPIRSERGNSKMWIVGLVVLGLVGLACLPVFGAAAFWLLLEAPPPAPPRPPISIPADPPLADPPRSPLEAPPTRPPIDADEKSTAG